MIVIPPLCHLFGYAASMGLASQLPFAYRL